MYPWLDVRYGFLKNMTYGNDLKHQQGLNQYKTTTFHRMFYKPCIIAGKQSHPAILFLEEPKDEKNEKDDKYKKIKTI